MSLLDKSRNTKRECAQQGKLFDDPESVKQPVSSDTHSKRGETDATDAAEERTMICPECMREFSCTVEELELHSKLDYSRPIRCPMCRLARYVRRSRKARRKS